MEFDTDKPWSHKAGDKDCPKCVDKPGQQFPKPCNYCREGLIHRKVVLGGLITVTEYEACDKCNYQWNTFDDKDDSFF
jgi:hypothetical protein